MKSFKIIAEIGSTHDGKIDLALKSIKKQPSVVLI